MTPFESEVELSISVPESEIRSARSAIESGIGSAELAVGGDGPAARAVRSDGGTSSGGGQQGRKMFRWARQRTSYLEDSVELLASIEGKVGGGGGGGGIGSFLGGVGARSLLGGATGAIGGGLLTGTLSVPASSVLAVSGTLGLAASAVLAVTGTIDMNAADILKTTGVLTVGIASAVAITGVLGLSAGAVLAVTGTLGLAASAVLAVAGVIGLNTSDILSVSGVLTVGAAAALAITGTLSLPAAAVIAVAGTLTVAASEIFDVELFPETDPNDVPEGFTTTGGTQSQPVEGDFEAGDFVEGDPGETISNIQGGNTQREVDVTLNQDVTVNAEMDAEQIKEDVRSEWERALDDMERAIERSTGQINR